MVRILCEEKIPYAIEAFSGFGEVATLPVHEIVRETVRDTDILLVRSGTRIDSALLDGTRVRFVASATAGTDHVDRAYLEARRIPFVHAPGCNADAVVEYVIAALYHCARQRGERLAGKTVGIVGGGNVGGRLARRLPALGLPVLLNDPWLDARAREAGEPSPYLPLEAVLERADILTFHTPLVRESPHPSFHLLDAARMQRLRPGAWLVNAARGGVVDNAALAEAIDAGRFGAVVLDVWEGEPVVSLDLMARVDLATAHIAGHSFEGKVNGTVMLYRALEAYLGREGGWNVDAVMAPAPGDRLTLRWPVEAPDQEARAAALVRQMYDIAADDAAFREALTLPAEAQAAFFLRMRRDYPRRRTFSMFTLAAPPLDPVEAETLREGLALAPVTVQVS